ncbi:MAG TPA: HAMP domain-containing sensor histidine kinase [Nitrososphaeraceae archaeon]|nr:HAMP domain-containing sensor histidine kinase [Nitrososphaeraceae archaeon]
MHRAQVINAIVDVFYDAEHRIDICGNSKFPSLIFSFEPIRKAIIVSKNKGIRQRYIIEVTKENIQYCKELTKLVDDLRHSDQIEANFALNETKYLGSITLNEPHQQAIYSNVKEVIEQQHYIFDNVWNKSIGANEKIREIEEGIESEFYEIITDNEKAKNVFIDLAKSIEKEALLLFANSQALIRSDKLGIINYLIEASAKAGAMKGATIRIICPLTIENSHVISKILEKAPDIRILNSEGSHSGLFIVDSSRFMRFELKEPRAEDFSEAIGFVVYSNSKVGIDSSKVFFELLWNERIQYEKLREYERLKEIQRMKDEFINVAAHELRTPIQPILGLSEVLHTKIKDIEQRQLLDTITRNAKRLQRLTDDILDVTKIESQSLKLNKERFNVNELIPNIIDGYRNYIEKDNVQVKLLYEPNNKDNIFVEADRGRIIQVISNLIGNAIKFTKEGTISVITEEKDNQVVVSLKDTGTGIDPEILPQLFSKFVTKSFQGTGLGLFISKSIVEAHGGRIWAENNSDNRGATFSFSLPISNHEDNNR